MKVLKKSSLFLACLSLSVVLTGCGTEKIENIESYVSSIEQIDVKEGVKVIGLGEATHGNVEFQQLKKDVFKTLLNNEDVRIFILEGDFGGGQKVNDFIQNGTASAEEAIQELDYDIYKTDEMVELIQWMHDYNQTVSDDEKIYFYGNDMQRYDQNKEGLFLFLTKVNADGTVQYQAQLADVTNEKMRDLSEEKLKEVSSVMDQIMVELTQNEEAYTEKTSPKEFAFAQKYAQLLKQRTELFLQSTDYNELRDRFMAENVQWIVDLEASRGNNSVLVAAHNGHIEKKSSTVAGYTSMGKHLDDAYGETYYAIGTDFINNTFQALNRKSDERKTYKLKHDNELLDQLTDIDGNILYIDFEQASESDMLNNILTSTQPMGNVGDDFRGWNKWLSTFYTIQMVPAESYDSLIVVKEANPTTVNE